MLGSAAQNVIVLTDNVFLFHRSDLEFASIGLIGVFYLIIASIGFGFSRGGQILIARRFGQGRLDELRDSFHGLLIFELLIGLAIFLFLQFLSPWFFSLFIDSPLVLEKCLEYIYPRSYGIFFSYLGVSIVALYTGIAKTKFIIVDTLILTVVNVILNYFLIFGHAGFPELGIAGAGWASTIAEAIAFVVFVVYMIMDRHIRPFNLFSLPRISSRISYEIYRISMPMVAQAILSIGSWFFLFSLIENLGQRALAISNLLRNVYLILSIPCWGFSTGINTIVSNFIGQNKRQAVIPMIKKTAWLCFIVTMVISIPVVTFPDIFLYPLFGGTDMSLIEDTRWLFYILLALLTVFAPGSIIFNGLIGTGDTPYALRIQFIATVLYVIYIYLAINSFELDLSYIWMSEFFYWTLIAVWSGIYLSRRSWYTLRI